MVTAKHLKMSDFKVSESNARFPVLHEDEEIYKDLNDAMMYGSYNLEHMPAWITIIDDISKRPINQDWTICILVNIHCVDGVRRIGYYHDQNHTIISDCYRMLDCIAWAQSFDSIENPVAKCCGLPE